MRLSGPLVPGAVLLGFLLCVFVPHARGGLLSEDLALHHFIQTEAAYRYRKSAAFTKLLNLYQVEARYPLNRKMVFTGVGRVSYDAISDLKDLSEINPFQDRFQSGAPREIPEVDPFDADLREFFADLYFAKVDLRLGKQIARWGVIEGFRITDELNPLDFGEFILRELTDRYIPLWMAKADVYLRDLTIEVVWIPDLTFHRPALPGTEWEEFQRPPGLETPARTFENTEIGLRISTRFMGADMAVSFLDAWDDFPTASRTIFGLGGDISERSADFTPRHHRLKRFGLSISKGIGSDLIKGEMAYILGKHFGTFAVDLNGDGVSDVEELERDHLKYGLGWDTRLPGKLDAFLQFSQQWIFNHNDLIIAEEVESGLSFLVQRDFLYDRLRIHCLILYFFNDRDALIRPRVSYQWTDYLRISMGADIFEGNPGDIQADDFHFIGFFDQNDRVYVEIRTSF
ncbi:MAG: hypothetical protein ACE5GK_10715 [Nitrospiria bacterium]